MYTPGAPGVTPEVPREKVAMFLQGELYFSISLPVRAFTV
jgi:hypothetical protein